MRFFAHDGKSTHGPAGIEELLKLPGFDGDTLVCPVGSDDTADWKPALAYPPFKKALFEAEAAPPAPIKPPDSPIAALAPMPALPPMPALTPMAPLSPMSPSAPLASLKANPPPPPAAKTVPCPSCAHSNLEEARFCNSCGARMDGRAEDISPAPSAPLPPTPPPFATLPPAPAPSAALPPAPTPAPPAPVEAPKVDQEPAFDPFAHLDPMLSFPTEPAPMSLPESPRRPLQPGKMGQLGEVEEAAPAASYSSPAPALAPEPAPAAKAVPVWKRPAVLAAFVGTALAAAGLGYVMLSKRAPAAAVAELTPTAQIPMPEPVPIPAPAQPLYSTPPATASPAMPAPRAPKPKKISKPAGPPSTAAAKPKRARKPRPSRAPKPQVAKNSGGGDTFIESRAPEPKPKGKAAAKTDREDRDPLLEALLTDATQPTAEAGAKPAAQSAAKAGGKSAPKIGQRPAAKPSQFTLPGLQRPVSASDRAASPKARAPLPPSEEIPPTHIAGLDASVPALAEPGKSSPTPGIEDEPAKSAEGDQLALVQVHEQFDFCAQLLAQGAFGDHYDTCLCKDAREAAPYRGRRGFYVSAKKKDASAGHLETSAKILSSKIDAGVAKVSARWKAGSADKGRDATQTWKLEDGLWCQAP